MEPDLGALIADRFGSDTSVAELRLDDGHAACQPRVIRFLANRKSRS
jgi:hypothetical protein